MDAIKYLKTRERMCNQYKGNTIPGCVDCPLLYIDDKCIGCGEYEKSYIEEAVKIVEEWGINNPAKTNWDKFVEIFPEMADIDNIPPAVSVIPSDWWSEEYKGDE